MGEAIVEWTTEEGDDEPNESSVDNTSKNTCCLEKERTPKKRFKKPVKR